MHLRINLNVDTDMHLRINQMCKIGCLVNLCREVCKKGASGDTSLDARGSFDFSWWWRSTPKDGKSNPQRNDYNEYKGT